MEIPDKFLALGWVCSPEVLDQLPPPVNQLYKASQAAEVLQVHRSGEETKKMS